MSMMPLQVFQQYSVPIQNDDVMTVVLISFRRKLRTDVQSNE